MADTAELEVQYFVHCIDLGQLIAINADYHSLFFIANN